MKKTEFKTKWYYRLLKIVFYTLYLFYIITLVAVIFTIIANTIKYSGIGSILSFLLLPLGILFIEIIRFLFYYIIFGKRDYKERILIFKKYIFLDKIKNGITRKNFLIFSIIITVLFLILGYLIGETYYKNIFSFSLFILFFYILIGVNLFVFFKRFNYIGQSGWKTLLLFIPIYNIYLFFKLLITNNNNNNNKVIKQNVFGIIFLYMLFVFVWLSLVYYMNSKEYHNIIKNKTEYKAFLDKKHKEELDLISKKYNIKFTEKQIKFFNKYNDICFKINKYNIPTKKDFPNNDFYFSFSDLECHKSHKYKYNNYEGGKIYYEWSNYYVKEFKYDNFDFEIEQDKNLNILSYLNNVNFYLVDFKFFLKKLVK